jgi:hypothetical protein
MTASESFTITPVARGYLARAAAEAREARVDAASQAALDGAARLGIGKPLFDGGIIPGTICEHSGTRVHVMGKDGSCEYCHKDLILVAYEDMREQ